MKRKNRRNVDSNTPGGVLTRMKNKLLALLRIDATRFNLLVEKYAIKLNDGKRDTVSQSTRTNLMSAFNSDSMTIKRFFIFLMALEIKKVKISVTITTKTDEEYTVEETAVFRNEEPVNLKERESNEND